jgi:biotin carboxylase
MDPAERFLCLASYETGHDFLRQCAEMGVKVTLLTLDKLRDAAWPRELLEELATMPAGLNREQILNTVSWMARARRFDRVVALHEADLETAAQIREHMRVPGMGTTTAGCYRDKLAQRVIARAFGCPVPEFCRILNYDEIRDYMERFPGPWLLKPRWDASSAAGRRIEDTEQLWRALDELGDAQSRFILEKFVRGDVLHVDSIVSESEVVLSIVLQSRVFPHQLPGTDEIFTICTVDRDSRDAKELTVLNRALAPSLGMMRGVTHAKFLRSHADGSYYFLEIGARVGGAFVDKVVEAATGVNLWLEWARLEVSNLRQTTYVAPDSRDGYAGGVVCASQGTGPDLDAFADPAIVARIRRGHRTGLIVWAAGQGGVQNLLDDYTAQFEVELAASAARTLSE